MIVILSIAIIDFSVIHLFSLHDWQPIKYCHSHRRFAFTNNRMSSIFQFGVMKFQRKPIVDDAIKKPAQFAENIGKNVPARFLIATLHVTRSKLLASFRFIQTRLQMCSTFGWHRHELNIAFFQHKNRRRTEKSKWDANVESGWRSICVK